MTRLFATVFPGQGSQRVGMFGPLARDGEVQRLLEAAESLTGLPLREIAADGPDTALADTRVAQPLLYIADVAWSAVVLEDAVPAYVAGHSLGELVALAVAGAYSVDDGLRLVCERGRLMSEAAARTPGGMAAVLGLDAEVVGEALAPLAGVWAANDNAPGQIVISGTHEGIETATRVLSEAGARKIIPLAVAGPFHCPLMAEAALAFAEVLGAIPFADARIPVVQNAEPEPTLSADVLRTRLLAQITAPVRWTETMSVLRDNGVTTLIECGPGAVLTGLARKTEGMDALSVETAGLGALREVLAS